MDRDRRMNPRRLDLNLLVVFEALVSERSVSAAARRLHLTQPAASHALARLREAFGDPVLEREGRAMRPTSRAAAALPEVRALLAQSTRLFSGSGRFDPASGERTFHVGASDYASLCVLPALVRRLRREAPGVRIVVRHAGRVDAPDAVRSGALDLAFGVFPNLTPDLHAATLREEPYRCAVARRAARQRRMTRDEYLGAAHVNVMVQGDTLGLVDEALARLGQQRRVSIVVPHFEVACALVADTDLVLTAPSGLLQPAQRRLPLALFAPPVPLPGFRTQMIWAMRQQGDEALGWLRRVAGGTGGAAGPRA
jgi:DNA-binding transcriptional LysR family regulator